MNEHLLSITAECRNNPSCVFNGKDIEVDIHVTNATTNTVRFPAAYVQRRGPTIRLVDKASGADRHLKTLLANRALMKEYVALAPRETISISTVLKAAEISVFRRDYIDLTAEIGAAAKIRLATDEEVPYDGTAVLRIIGLDTYEREQQSR